MLLDDDASNWDWGIAPAHAIDTLSIVTHELVHALGLGHPDVSCTYETMHRCCTPSSITPRDLAAGDSCRALSFPLPLGQDGYWRGSPRPRVAMMFLWISEVPAKIV